MFCRFFQNSKTTESELSEDLPQGEKVEGRQEMRSGNVLCQVIFFFSLFAFPNLTIPSFNGGQQLPFFFSIWSTF